jgi:hypothetical protein
VRFVVLRKRVRTEVTVTTALSVAQPGVPIVGITLGTGYRYEPQISFDLGQRIGGPSAGLAALAIYDKITDGPLRGMHVAGTGQITRTAMSARSAGSRRRSLRRRTTVQQCFSPGCELRRPGRGEDQDDADRRRDAARGRGYCRRWAPWRTSRPPACS